MEVTGGDYARTVVSLAHEKALRAAAGIGEPGTVQKTASLSVQSSGDDDTQGEFRE
jgi:hypothetical protein